MKKLFKIMFFVTLALVLLSLVFVIVSVVSHFNSFAGATGIIGGADGPSARFITRTLIFAYPMFRVLIASALLCATSAIGWFVTKNK